MAENGLEEDKEENNNETKLEPWVRIQQNTFTNWMNDKLRIFDIEIQDLKREIKDGVLLCKLMNALKGKSIGKIKEKKNMNHYESSGNIALALEAMRADGVKLVNIGAEDIAGGNIKLILGMLWTLIRVYQIGSQSSLPPKKLMLSWVNAVLHPHRKVTNFDKDWNDGIALFGVIEYCQPGLASDWMHKTDRDRLANCAQAMTIAQDQLNIPMVVDPQNFCSRDLDELSGMTYLSYFMAKDSPGYNATLNWVRSQVSEVPVHNFDKDWNNGFVLNALVNSLTGGSIVAESSNWMGTLKKAMDTSQTQLKVDPVIPPKEMMKENVDHIGVMAYAAWHQHAGPSEPVPAPPPVAPPPPPVAPPVEVIVTRASPVPESESDPEPEPEIPTPAPVIKFDPDPVIIPDPEPIIEPPSPITHAAYWRINVPNNITVYSKDIDSPKIWVKGTALSPSGQEVMLSTSKIDEHMFQLTYTPKEKGVWTVSLVNSEESSPDNYIEGSPFEMSVYDVSKVRLVRDETQETVEHSSTYEFMVDCFTVYCSDITAYVLYDGESMEHEISPVGNQMYKVSFPANHVGLYTVAVYCGGLEVPGSPFTLRSKNLEGVWAEGDGIKSGYAGRDSNFTINFKEKVGGFVKVKILSPDEKEVDAIVRNIETGIVNVQYTPLIPGYYKIEIYYDGLVVQGSPYTVLVNGGKVFIKDLDYTAKIGEKSSFILDASAAGKGTLEIDSDLPILQYDNVGERVYSITFVPKKLGKHELLIKYNSQTVEGCPCEIDVQEQEPAANSTMEENPDTEPVQEEKEAPDSVQEGKGAPDSLQEGKETPEPTSASESDQPAVLNGIINSENGEAH